jgi:hypothetical protein
MLKDDFAKHATTRDAMCVFGVGGGWGEGSLCSKAPFYETLDFLGAIVQHRKTAEFPTSSALQTPATCGCAPAVRQLRAGLN